MQADRKQSLSAPTRSRRRLGAHVIGSGDHARVVGSVLEAAAIPILGYYDDEPETWGIERSSGRVLGPISEIPSGSRCIIGIGDNYARKRIADALDMEWITGVHPFSWIAPGVQIGPGTVVCPGAVVMVGAKVGSHVILNNRAGVGHDATVDDFAHLTVAHLGGGATAGEGCLMGIGSVVLPRQTVGAWATVGAGAVVTRNVPPGAVVFAVPAKVREIKGAHAARVEWEAE